MDPNILVRLIQLDPSYLSKPPSTVGLRAINIPLYEHNFLAYRETCAAT
jgi:hypothetical protein